MKAGAKSLVTLALALLAFPIIAVADNTNSITSEWINSGATVGARDGFSLASTVTAGLLSNGSWMTGKDLGSVQLTTGKLLSGSLKQGCLGAYACSFSFVDSSFTIAGANDAPSFSGKFGSNIVLAGTCVKGTCTYSITGAPGGGVELTTLGGQPVGSTVLSFMTKGKFTGGSMTAISGTGLTNVTVPEPGTLGLLGVGLAGLAVILRRKTIRT